MSTMGINMNILGLILVIVYSYLLGSINFAIIISKKLKGIDPREVGSNNPGTTNVLRTAGVLPAVLTLLGDIAKASVAVGLSFFLARWTMMDNGYILVQASMLFVVLGHMFPIFFKFKGGKGIATGIGGLLVLNWQIALIVMVFAITIIIFTRYISLRLNYGNNTLCCIIIVFNKYKYN